MDYGLKILLKGDSCPAVERVIQSFATYHLASQKYTGTCKNFANYEVTFTLEDIGLLILGVCPNFIFDEKQRGIYTSFSTTEFPYYLAVSSL